MIGNNDDIYDTSHLSTTSPLKKASQSQLFRSQPFVGQMGVICLIQNPMIAEDVKKLFDLGPNFTVKSNTENTDILSGQKGSTLILDRKGIAKIIFFYTPKAIEGMLCIDISSAQNRNVSYTNYYATKMEGVKEWNTKSFHDVIPALGGVKLVLTLLTMSTNTSSSEFVEAVHQDPSSIFVLLLKMALHSCSTFEEQMIGLSGFQVLGFLLEHINPNCFTLDTVSKLDHLTTFILKIYGYCPLLLSLLRHVILNFRIWIYTHYTVQLKLIQAIASYSTRNETFFRNEIGVNSFIDIIKYFYWLHPLKNKRIIIDKDVSNILFYYSLFRFVLKKDHLMIEL
jgi:hypothetical protein